MKTYTYKQMIELRVSLPYGSFKSISEQIGYKTAYGLKYLLENPQNMTEEIYDEIVKLGSEWRIDHTLGKTLVGEYDHGQQLLYFNRLNDFISSPEFVKLQTVKKLRVIEEQKRLKQIFIN